MLCLDLQDELPKYSGEKIGWNLTAIPTTYYYSIFSYLE